METKSVNARMRDLLEPVLGLPRTEGVIQWINGLEGMANVQALLPFLTPKPEEMAGISPAH